MLLAHTYEAKYPKAATLVDGRHQRVTFFDFLTEHWLHLRTTNGVLVNALLELLHARSQFVHGVMAAVVR
jgi:transposase-like protein